MCSNHVKFKTQCRSINCLLTVEHPHGGAVRSNWAGFCLWVKYSSEALSLPAAWLWLLAGAGVGCINSYQPRPGEPRPPRPSPGPIIQHSQTHTQYHATILDKVRANINNTFTGGAFMLWSLEAISADFVRSGYPPKNFIVTGNSSDISVILLFQ